MRCRMTEISHELLQVYAYNKERFSADGFYVIPTSELAYSYVLAAFDPANIATQFGISGTADTTTIQVTLPSPGQCWGLPHGEIMGDMER